MRYRTLAGSLVFAFVCATPALAQQPPATAELFARASSAQKTSALTQIIKHEFVASADTLAGILTAGLSDAEPRVREATLAAIVSRAAGPRFSRTTAVINDWVAEQVNVRRLRPRIIGALQDSSEAVRLQAVAALASLDFDIASSDLELSPATQQILIQRFYADPSARVRAKIVAGFGTDPVINTPAATKVFLDAFRDPDYRVRHAAASGTGKLERSTAIALVVEQLRDPNRSVRIQAATILTRFGPAALSHLSDVQSALEGERDPEVRRFLESAVAAIGRQR